MSSGCELAVSRIAELGGVIRAGFYRFRAEPETRTDPDMVLRDAIQRIALEWPAYGRRRITEEQRRLGLTVDPKRVYQLMKEDNLLCVRK